MSAVRTGHEGDAQDSVLKFDAVSSTTPCRSWIRAS